jgi:hypothetical protein
MIPNARSFDFLFWWLKSFVRICVYSVHSDEYLLGVSFTRKRAIDDEVVFSWLQISCVGKVCTFLILSRFGQILPLINGEHISDIIEITNIEQYAVPAT